MNYNDTHQIIILAAGKGTRMGTNLPKVMHKIGGVPMLEAVLKNSLKVTNDVVIVYSKQLEEYLTPYKNLCKFALQEEQLGTGNAVYAAIGLINPNKIVAVLYGDHPLITPDIIDNLINHLESTNSDLVTLAFKTENPAQYGRIVTDEAGNFLEIVEFKNATEKEKEIKLCNSGIMAFAPGILTKHLDICISEGSSNPETYLTSMVKICRDSGHKVSYLSLESEDSKLLIGVNTQAELLEATSLFDDINY
ncbi:MAG TPA: NTP transferase domain-containing protein [Rickettsia endosymbiont of Pyrocoelia pectoralis]|nr:NTP transferase domain-containing protein [Rickettsia endosymbiont of Pyrocoelia pectoralis]